MQYKIFWGDTHHNLFMNEEDEPDFEGLFQDVRANLDFSAPAYYTPDLYPYKPEANPIGKIGFRLEAWKSSERIAREWSSLQDATRKYNEDGSFVTFPGYEWQGDSSSGDHSRAILIITSS